MTRMGVATEAGRWYNWPIFAIEKASDVQPPWPMTHRRLDPVSTPNDTTIDPACKRCTKCGEVKALGEFGKRGAGRANRCKSCWAEKSREWAARNRDLVRQTHQRYRERHPERRRQHLRASVVKARAEWIDRLKARESEFWALTARADNGCLIWQGKRTTTGYGSFPIGSVAVKAHRAAYALAIGDPGDLMVCHRCDTPLCCEPSCLFAGTAKDNAGDASRKGRMHPGERTAGSIVTESIVKAMRLDYLAKMSFRAIGDKYGLSAGGARSAIIGRSWGHVPGAVPPRKPSETNWVTRRRNQELRQQ